MTAPRLLLLLAALLALAPVAVVAQTVGDRLPAPSSADVIRPGDPRLALDSVLAPSVVRMRLVITRGGETMPLGTLTETVYRLPGGTLARVQHLATARGSQTDSLVFTASLAPLAHTSFSAARTISLRYDGAAVTGTYETSTGTTGIDDVMASSAFDSNVIDLVARAIPLGDGFAAAVQTYERTSATDLDTDVAYTVRVSGAETVGGRAGVVVAFGKPGADETRLVVDPRTRRVLRMTSDVAPGVTMTGVPVN